VVLETGVGGSNLIGAYVTLFGAFYHLLGDSPSLVRPSSRSIGAGKHLQNTGIVVHSPRFFEFLQSSGEVAFLLIRQSEL